MEMFQVTWWMVLVGVLVSMLSGMVWYNPKVFFNVWWSVVGNGKETPGMENMGMVWGLTVLSSAVKAYFIGVAVNVFAPALGGFTLWNGVLTGLILWTGFIAPTYLVNKLFASHGAKVWAIETGNHLVDILILAGLFGLIG